MHSLYLQLKHLLITLIILLIIREAHQNKEVQITLPKETESNSYTLNMISPSRSAISFFLQIEINKKYLLTYESEQFQTSEVTSQFPEYIITLFNWEKNFILLLGEGKLQIKVINENNSTFLSTQMTQIDSEKLIVNEISFLSINDNKCIIILPYNDSTFQKRNTEIYIYTKETGEWNSIRKDDIYSLQCVFVETNAIVFCIGKESKSLLVSFSFSITNEDNQETIKNENIQIYEGSASLVQHKNEIMGCFIRKEDENNKKISCFNPIIDETSVKFNSNYVYDKDVTSNGFTKLKLYHDSESFKIIMINPIDDNFYILKIKDLIKDESNVERTLKFELETKAFIDFKVKDNILYLFQRFENSYYLSVIDNYFFKTFTCEIKKKCLLKISSEQKNISILVEKDLEFLELYSHKNNGFLEVLSNSTRDVTLSFFFENENDFYRQIKINFVPENCEVPDEEVSNKCKKCNQGFFLNLVENTCEKQKERYYGDNETGTFIECPENCKSCEKIKVDLVICTDCLESTILFNSRCVNNCTNDHYIQENTCVEKCSENYIGSKINKKNVCSSLKGPKKFLHTKELEVFERCPENQTNIILSLSKEIEDMENVEEKLSLFLEKVYLFNQYYEKQSSIDINESDLEKVLNIYSNNIINIIPSIIKDKNNTIDSLETNLLFLKNSKYLSESSIEEIVNIYNNTISSLISSRTLLDIQVLTSIIKINNRIFSASLNNHTINDESYFFQNKSLEYQYNNTLDVTEKTKKIYSLINSNLKLVMQNNENSSYESSLYDLYYSSLEEFVNFTDYIISSSVSFHDKLLVTPYEIIKEMKKDKVQRKIFISKRNSKVNNIKYLSIVNYKKYPFSNPLMKKNVSSIFFGIDVYDENKSLISLKKLDYPIQMIIRKDNINFTNCVFYDEKTQELNDEGCKSENLDEYVICSCNHLTDFSIASFSPFELINHVAESDGFYERRFMNSFSLFNKFTCQVGYVLFIFAGLFLLYFLLLIFSIKKDLDSEDDGYIRTVEELYDDEKVANFRSYIDDLIDEIQEDNKTEQSSSNEKTVNDIEKNNESRKSKFISTSEIEKSNVNKNFSSTNLQKVNNENKIPISINKSFSSSSENDTKKECMIELVSFSEGQSKQSDNKKIEELVNDLKENVNNPCKKKSISHQVLTSPSLYLFFLPFRLIYGLLFKYEYPITALPGQSSPAITKSHLLTLLIFRMISQIFFCSLYSPYYNVKQKYYFSKSISISFIGLGLSIIPYVIFRFFLTKTKFKKHENILDKNILKYKKIFQCLVIYCLMIILSVLAILNTIWISLYAMSNKRKIYFVFDWLICIGIDYLLFQNLLILLKAIILTLIVKTDDYSSCRFKFLSFIVFKIPDAFLLYETE